jgi:hypothetical protein
MADYFRFAREPSVSPKVHKTAGYSGLAFTVRAIG